MNVKNLLTLNIHVNILQGFKERKKHTYSGMLQACGFVIRTKGQKVFYFLDETQRFLFDVLFQGHYFEPAK